MTVFTCGDDKYVHCRYCRSNICVNHSELLFQTKTGNKEIIDIFIMPECSGSSFSLFEM